MPVTTLHPIVRFWKKIEICPHNQCWVWQGAKQSDGYGHIRIERKSVLAHRFSYEFYVEEIPLGLFVLHRCHNRSCVSPIHLYLGTHRNNMDDMIHAGRQGKCQGTAHGAAKLTETDVRDIRASSLPGAELARKYGVHKSAIYKIRHRQRWRHI